jgi:glycosyltransferase involved in cell wall biosynthesis
MRESKLHEFTSKVSIIIPVYNGELTIKNCLDSLLAQDYPSENLDVIVVNNCSTDNTVEIVAAYPVQLYHCDERGPAAARNFGIARTDAEIIAFTDADCVAESNWITELVRPYTDSKVGGVGGEIFPFQHPEETGIELFSAEFAPLVNYSGGENEFLPHLYTSNASYRRKLLNTVGGFKPELVTCEDVDLSWRIQLETGARLEYAPTAIIYHHHRSSRAGLARQYRQYGFGEILLDTIFKDYKGYPRSRAFQIKRILGQLAALPRYILSGIKRSILFRLGRIDSYQASVPWLWYLVERRNIRGKIEAMIATSWMTGTQKVRNQDVDTLIATFYGGEKKHKNT